MSSELKSIRKEQSRVNALRQFSELESFSLPPMARLKDLISTPAKVSLNKISMALKRCSSRISQTFPTTLSSCLTFSISNLLPPTIPDLSETLIADLWKLCKRADQVSLSQVSKLRPVNWESILQHRPLSIK